MQLFFLLPAYSMMHMNSINTHIHMYNCTYKPNLKGAFVINLRKNGQKTNTIEKREKIGASYENKVVKVWHNVVSKTCSENNVKRLLRQCKLSFARPLSQRVSMKIALLGDQFLQVFAVYVSFNSNR